MAAMARIANGIFHHLGNAILQQACIGQHLYIQPFGVNDDMVLNGLTLVGFDHPANNIGQHHRCPANGRAAGRQIGEMHGFFNRAQQVVSGGADLGGIACQLHIAA